MTYGAITRFAVSAVALALSAASGPVQAETHALGGAGTREVQVGDELTWRVFSNPSTGIHWRLAATPAGTVQTVVDGRRVAADPADRRIGGGAVFEWRFRALAPGEAALRFERIDARVRTGPVQTQVFRVRVRAPAAGDGGG